LIPFSPGANQTPFSQAKTHLPFRISFSSALLLITLVISYGEDILALRGSSQIVIHKITLCKSGKDSAIFGSILLPGKTLLP
jgi:hypothetical protein